MYAFTIDLLMKSDKFDFISAIRTQFISLHCFTASVLNVFASCIINSELM